MKKGLSQELPAHGLEDKILTFLRLADRFNAFIINILWHFLKKKKKKKKKHTQVGYKMYMKIKAN